MRYATGVVLVAVASALWSLMGLAIRQIEVADTWAVLFWRSAGMIPVLVAFIAWRSGGRAFARLRATGWTGVAGGAGLVLAFSGAIYAIQATTVANAVFLFAASPFLTAALGRIVLGEAVRPATWGAMALALVGMAVMVREGLALGALDGNLAALASAAGFAVFTVTLRRGRLGDMMPAVVIGGMMSMLLAAVVLAATGAPLMVPAAEIAVALAMGAVILAAGMVLYTLGSQAVPAAELALITMIEAMLAPIWVWLILGETASVATLYGGVAGLGAVALNALTGMRRAPLAPPVT
ncbi:MAG: DMT family transporter [Gemmobacter sp.]